MTYPECHPDHLQQFPIVHETQNPLRSPNQVVKVDIEQTAHLLLNHKNPGFLQPKLVQKICKFYKNPIL